MNRSDQLIWLLILLVAASLRIFQFWDFSLSNDELSALARLGFDTFHDLLHQGIKIDGHPPAAQVLLWAVTGLFGDSTAVVRAPFVLAGILAVHFVFKMGKEWSGTATGLLSAALFATLSFPILYSRIARPYALGMLFTVMAGYFWIKTVRGRAERSDLFWLAVALALSAYSHYFAALTAAIMAVTGTFLITGRPLRSYLLSLLLAFILYLPYIPFFLHQLSLGGVGEWLGPPEIDWPITHLSYAFNDSYWLMSVVGVIALIGTIRMRSAESSRPWVALLLFMVPMAIGFGYSRWVNPVLQHSTLLFSFPFLLIFVFSGWRDGGNKLAQMLSLLLLLAGTYSTVFANRFYQTEHFGVFKEIGQHISEWSSKTEERTLRIGDFNHPSYIDRYLNETSLHLYRTTDEKGLVHLKHMVDTSKARFAIYGWSTVNQSPEVQAVIRQKFPKEIERRKHFNAEAVMYGKGETEPVYTIFSFEKNNRWNFNPEMVVSSDSSTNFILINEQSAFGPTCFIPLKELTEQGFQELTVRVELESADDPTGMLMVYEQSSSEERYAWESDAFDLQQGRNSPNWSVFVYKLKPVNTAEDVLKVYPWLPDGGEAKLTSMQVWFD